MAQTKAKKKNYAGKNVRISDAVFSDVKAFVDEKGWKLGKFVENACLKELYHQTENQLQKEKK